MALSMHMFVHARTHIHPHPRMHACLHSNTAACAQVAKRLAHSFPWCPSASVHLALCLRRRSGSNARTTALVRPSDQRPPSAGRAPTAAPAHTTNLNVLETRQMEEIKIKHLPTGARRRRLIKVGRRQEGQCVC